MHILNVDIANVLSLIHILHTTHTVHIAHAADNIHTAQVYSIRTECVVSTYRT